jgi:hypothetical protein
LRQLQREHADICRSSEGLQSVVIDLREMTREWDNSSLNIAPLGSLPNLRSLELDNIPYPLDLEPVRYWPGITKLDIRFLFPTNIVLQSLVGHPTLKELAIEASKLNLEALQGLSIGSVKYVV